MNQWYEKKATGHFVADPWVVFWKGIRAGDVPGVVDFCTGRAADFA